MIAPSGRSGVGCAANWPWAADHISCRARSRAADRPVPRLRLRLRLRAVMPGRAGAPPSPIAGAIPGPTSIRPPAWLLPPVQAHGSAWRPRFRARRRGQPQDHEPARHHARPHRRSRSARRPWSARPRTRPGGVHARHERRPTVGHADGVTAGGQQDIGRADHSRVDADTGLIRTPPVVRADPTPGERPDRRIRRHQ